MNLEIALDKIDSIRKNFHRRHLEESKVFSGIKNLDKLLMGFDSQKIYTIVAKKGNGIYSLANTLANNIDVLYQTNYSVLLQKNETKDTEPNDFWQFLQDNQLFLSQKEVFSYQKIDRPSLVHKPILLIGNINGLSYDEIRQIIVKYRKRWHVEVLVIFLYILNDDTPSPLFIEEIPIEVKENSDVILSLFRPEYYHTEIREDGTSIENQMEVSVLKNYKPIMGSTKLFIDKENKRVKSINVSFLSKWSDKFTTILNQEKNK